MSDFERELEQELHRVVDPIIAAPSPPRRRLQPRGSIKKKLLGGAGAALGLKVLTGVAAAAAAITVAGAATEIATTGTVNPQDWGNQVSRQVQTCKDTLRDSGTRGIGQCVSEFAKHHGAAERRSPAGGAGDNGNGKANAKSQGNANSHGKNKGNANGHGNGKGRSSTA